MKWCKFIVGLFLLLPGCVLATAASGAVFLDAWGAAVRGNSPLLVSFTAGLTVWLACFFLLPKPYTAYVFSHELSHAVWAWICGGRVTSFKVTAQGGHIKTDVPNFAVTLAPYFFPLYSLLAVWLWWLANFWVDLAPYLWVLYAVVGLTWGFHATFTLAALGTAQNDITSQGWLFSLSFIYLMNLVPLSLFLIALTPGLTLEAWWHHAAHTAYTIMDTLTAFVRLFASRLSL